MSSYGSTLRAPRKMDASVAEAMKLRLEKNNLSELGVNWIGKSHLNAIASDSAYEYHLAHLSDVYRGRSKLDNNTPRCVKKPPPWANLDRRVLSPIPDKEHREALWDDNFIHSNSHMDRTRALRISYSDSRSNAAKRRPSSAGVQRDAMAGLSISDAVRCSNRPSSANVRGRNIYGDKSGNGYFGVQDNLRWIYEGAASTRWGDSSSRRCGRLGQGYDTRDDRQARASHGRVAVSLYPSLENSTVEGTYTLDETQERTFRAFVAMLVDFDTFNAVRILDDAFLEAQLASGLQDFTGCGDD